MIRAIRLLSILICLCLTPPARAWNNVGHRVIAELAWRQLDKNERDKISALLKKHPHYEEFLVAHCPAGVDKNEWAFLNAANWPDWVRRPKEGRPPKPDSVTKYDLYPHAIGYPFLGPGETNEALLKDFFIAKPNAEMVLSNSITGLADTKKSESERAVDLCWTIHLMGDLHQPLHDANAVTTAHPHGDRLGGNHLTKFPDGRRIDLHSFWDELLGVDSSYQTAAKVSDRLSHDPGLEVIKLPEYQNDKTLASWVQEGFQIARDFAYSPKHVQTVRRDDVDSGKIPSSAIPALSMDYIREAHKIGDQRAVLAAQRLAEELKPAF